MKAILASVMVFSFGCVTVENAMTTTPPRDGRDSAAANQMRATLESLPRCAAGTSVGVMTVKPTVCTKMACQSACCNTCGWEATLELKNGETVSVPAARFREVLRVSESGLDCEVAAWAKVLVQSPMALDGTACVAR
jgi:hypothetical protein